MLFGGFPEGERLALKRLQSQLPPGGGVAFRERANFHGSILGEWFSTRLSTATSYSFRVTEIPGGEPAFMPAGLRADRSRLENRLAARNGGPTSRQASGSRVYWHYPGVSILVSWIR